MDDKNIALRGGIWTGISTASTMLAQFARIMILTRFLEKSDFGVVALSSMVIGLCVTFTDLGFASVIMYKQSLSKKEFSTLYWIQMIFYFFIYVLLITLSPLISTFYEEPILTTIIPLAGLSILFQSFGKLYDSVLQKRYYFKLLAIRNIVANYISLVVAWLLAYLGYGVYSLIYSTLFQVLFYNVWNITTGFKLQRIGLFLKLKEVVPLIKIGLYQTGTNLLDYIADKIDVLIIGKMLGTEVLGLYDLAKELVIKFLSFFKAIVSKVALPILANNNNNEEMIKSRFLMVSKVMAFVSIPICITISLFSEEAIYIVYGVNFLETAQLVSLFAIMGILSSLVGFFDMLGISKGRTDLNFMNTLCRLFVSIPIIIITSLISIYAVAWGQLLISCVMAVIVWNLVVRKTYPIPLSLYISQFGRYFLIIAISGVITAVIRWISPAIFDNLWGDSIVFGAFYIVLLLISSAYFMKNEYMFAKNILSMIKN